MVKVYWVLWMLLAATAAILFTFGALTMVIGVVFGFISFGMVFMGMIGVLPTMASHPPEIYPANTAIDSELVEKTSARRAHPARSAHA